MFLFTQQSQKSSGVPGKAAGDSGRYLAARIRNIFQKVFKRGLLVGQITRGGAELSLIANQR
jgi:hypothetical protein